jgi:hypothetical protein
MDVITGGSGEMERLALGRRASWANRIRASLAKRLEVGTRRRSTGLGVSYSRGDWVVVRTASEILATLDPAGRLDRLPFMPEMAAYCGQRMRVVRRSDRTCVEGYSLRDLKNTVHLHTMDVSGAAKCFGTRHGCGLRRLLPTHRHGSKPMSGRVSFYNAYRSETGINIFVSPRRSLARHRNSQALA